MINSSELNKTLQQAEIRGRLTAASTPCKSTTARWSPGDAADIAKQFALSPTADEPPDVESFLLGGKLSPVLLWWQLLSLAMTGTFLRPGNR